MSKHIIGLVLIDAPYSALNNAGSEASQRGENIVVVKTIRRGSQTYPYVSGQAWRNWWRTTLQNEFSWNVSPITRSGKGHTQVVYTDASPAVYDDDDVFGYMRAPKGKGDETVTRISPLKNSPLISIESHRPTDDYGVMARQEDFPAIHEHQFYSCVLKGIFSLDLSSVGAFSDINRTGYKNITPSSVQAIQDAGGTQVGERPVWVLPKETRVRRCQQTLEALPILSGGAKLTSHLTDVTPKLIILSVLDGGNHPFMNLIVEEKEIGKLSLPALREVIDDYADRFCDAIYIGRRNGFMDELDEDLRALKNDNDQPCQIVYDSPNKVIAQLSEKLETHIGETS
ncbi:MAG: type I-B CRISPR-associated protein Cas7/Cst2/DevR [Candidatus Poribacteria bacterium]|nr:type I-B CRISPR-associated protein Cas7/Cst2/DevR [Candidatus Poribacteria bacterium]